MTKKSLLMSLAIGIIALFLGTLAAQPLFASEFSDDFNDGDAVGWWLGYSQHTPSKLGDWVVEDEGAPHFGVLSQYELGDNFISLVDGVENGDQIVSTEVRLNDFGSYGGVTIWFQDDDNYINVKIYPANGFIDVFESDAGVEQTNYYYYPYSWDTWYNLKVVADSSTGELDVYVDDVYLFTHTTDVSVRYGRSGINMGNADTSFDNFMLEEFPPAPTPISTPTILGFLDPALSCGSITNIHTTTVDWTDSTGGSGVVGYDYKIDYPLPGGGTGHWSTYVVPSQRSGSLNEGLHTIMVRAKDSDGNFSEWSDSCSITADWTAPDVMIDSPEDGDVVSGMVEIYGTLQDDNPHHYYLVVLDGDGNKVAGPGTVNDDSTFSNKMLTSWDTTATPDGTYTIRLEARDAADNKDEGSVDVNTVKVDNHAPNVRIRSPRNRAVVSGTVDIYGKVKDANPDHYYLVILDQNGDKVAGPGTVDDTTSFWKKLLYSWDTTTVPDGKYTIRLEARDAAGNKDRGSVDVHKIWVNNIPDHKYQCKWGGWMNFPSLDFKNQGRCVSFVQSNHHSRKHR